MAELTKEQILAALDRVIDPISERSVVDRGLIGAIVIKNGNIGFALEVDPKNAQEMEPLRKACEKAVHDLPGVLSVSVALTAHSSGPIQGKERGPSYQQGHQMHEHGGHHGHSHAKPMSGGQPQGPVKPELPGIRSVVAVASGKGGVGKSTTSVNLAVAMARRGARVGLLDADIYGPSVPRMLGLSGKPDSDGKRIQPKEAYGLKVMSIGFLVDEDTPMIWRGPMVMSALEQMLRDTNWGELDVLVVDLPPGTGDAQLTMAQRVPLTGAVIVSTPQDIALLDVRRGVAMFDRVSVPTFGVIENMSYYHCPNCGHEAHIFGHGGAKALADELGAELLAQIPLDLEIRTTSDEGRPITATQPEGKHAEIYLQIANNILTKIDYSLGEGDRKAPRIMMLD